jgi:CheY-like chemotaxis protein
VSPQGGRRVLVVESNLRTQRELHKVLAATFHEVETVRTVSSSLEAVERWRPDLVVLGDGALAEAEPGELLADCAGRKLPLVVCLTQELPAARLHRLLGELPRANIVGGHHSTLFDELVVTVKKLVQGDIFGLDKYLSWGASIRHFELTTTEERLRLVKELVQDVKERVGRRHAEVVALIADELLSNALFNAPVDDNGHHYRADEPRTTQRDLVGRERVRLQFGGDGRYLGVAVTDYFGSVDYARVSSYLGKKFHSASEFDVQFDSAGAGAGLALIYKHSSHLAFNVLPGRQTEVVALLDIRQRISEVTLSSASLNFFIPEVIHHAN